MSMPRFFDNGIRFSCTGCADCCRTHGEYAYVYLSAVDVTRIAAHLGLAPVDFLNAHCATDPEGFTYLTMLDGACNFLSDDGQCRVYPVRPKQCATWPFWTENLKADVWHQSVVPCCPGIGRGRLYSREEILAIARQRDDWYLED